MNPARPQVVAIHGAPRSGTSWLGQLFNSSPRVAYRYQPLFSYAFRGRIDEHSDAASVRRFFADLAASDDTFVLQRGDGRLAAEEMLFPKQSPTHLVYKEVRFHQVLPRLLELDSALRGIGLVRDPRAVLASWLAAPREFDPGWRVDDEWRHAGRKNAGKAENWYGFERWKELAGLFLALESRFAGRFRILRYEDLARDPAATVRDLFGFCGLEFGAQTQAFVAASTTRDDGDPYGVVRSHRGASPGQGLPGEIAAAIEKELARSPLRRFLAHEGGNHG